MGPRPPPAATASPPRITRRSRQPPHGIQTSVEPNIKPVKRIGARSDTIIPPWIIVKSSNRFFHKSSRMVTIEEATNINKQYLKVISKNTTSLNTYYSGQLYTSNLIQIAKHENCNLANCTPNVFVDGEQVSSVKNTKCNFSVDNINNNKSSNMSNYRQIGSKLLNSACLNRRKNSAIECANIQAQVEYNNREISHCNHNNSLNKSLCQQTNLNPSCARVLENRTDTENHLPNLNIRQNSSSKSHTNTLLYIFKNKLKEYLEQLMPIRKIMCPPKFKSLFRYVLFVFVMCVVNVNSVSSSYISSSTSMTSSLSSKNSFKPSSYIPISSSSASDNVYCLGINTKCICSPDLLEISCRAAGFTAVPESLPPQLIKLDLTSNNISSLHEKAFASVPELEELILTDNKLEFIHKDTFEGLSRLKRLVLQNCSLIEVPAEALQPLAKLSSLQLDQNLIDNVEADSFLFLEALKNLRLENNRLRNVPTEALAALNYLEVLNLGNNLLTTIPADAFPPMGNLIILLMKRNQIVHIDDDAFVNLTSVRILELDGNQLIEIPMAITKLPALGEISVSSNRIKYIPGGVLQQSPSLSLLELKGNPLVGVDQNAFSHLPSLRKLILSEARDLTVFPSLNGTGALEILRLDRANLSSIPANLCRTCPRLKSLDLKSNKLTEIPELSQCHDLRVLDLASNNIASLEGNPFHGLSELHDLLLPHNSIQYLPQNAFKGLKKLQVLNLESNVIEDIHPDAFLEFTQLEDLNLGNNVFPELPTSGMHRLLHLKTHNNPHLRELPEPEHFPRVRTLILAYAYHCCAFVAIAAASEPQSSVPPLHDTVFFPKDNNFDTSIWNSSQTDIFWPQIRNLSTKFPTKLYNLFDAYGSYSNIPAYVDEYFEENGNIPAITESEPSPTKIQCLPAPGPFLPCTDLFDWWTLRCGVWIVFLLAMLGNGTVVFVLIFSRSKMDVPRFLVCNLAAADFFMGIYLGFLAVVDASTLGEFRMYAIPWQMSAGCQLAGFLGVLSSELSVYTLAVITLERNYAITHAMHLNKRLSLKHASYIMACGWSFALIMAVLPLLGVSDYRKFAICLPFETTTGVASLAYVVFLMFINGVAFLILMGCYLKMYCAIRGSQAWNSNDSRIAKRMALLVFTDFLCWSPIAFFSLTAAFGLQLISLEGAKVFTVFILPLNSCCNPFLYAILTKQFKKDCVLICKAIEESRVTRGIGRCRHSSNFSNRQTPANTNSLMDRSSREHVPTHHHAQACTCNTKLLADSSSGGGAGGGRGGTSDPQMPRFGPRRDARAWLLGKARAVLLCATVGRHGGSGDNDTRRRARSNDQYAYQIAEIQQKQHKRASSVSSSENFSSSRSDSWRHGHNCAAIPLRLLDHPKRRASSWLVTRKPSQESNLSSSRNDSSGSASTSTWRMSRSSASGVETGVSTASSVQVARQKPRLTRQCAVQHDDDLPVPPTTPPGRLTVRFLATIPSAAENSVQLDETDTASGVQTAPAPFYAILHTQPITTGGTTTANVARPPPRSPT